MSEVYGWPLWPTCKKGEMQIKQTIKKKNKKVTDTLNELFCEKITLKQSLI